MHPVSLLGKHPPPPRGIISHSMRNAPTSTALEARASIEELCRVATWYSSPTFIHHYKVVYAFPHIQGSLSFQRKMEQWHLPSRLVILGTDEETWACPHAKKGNNRG